MARTRCSLLSVGLLVFIPRMLLAQPPPSDNAVAQSRLHFDRGVQSYKDGSLDAALAEFTRAYELTHDYRLLYNVAQVESERHDYVRAIETLGEYLRQGGGAIAKERRIEVDNEVGRLRTRVGELWVSASAGAEVWIGNRMVAKLPLSSPILVNAGNCTVRIAGAGFKPVTRELTIAGGDRPRLEIQLESEVQAPDKPTPARDNTRLWISLAATGAVGAGAAVFGVLAKNADTTLDQRIKTFPSDPKGIDDARSTLRTDALVCDILLGATVVGAGTSLYFLLNPKYRTAEPETTSQRPSARLIPSPTGLIVKGTF